jgi:hypothetical protein
MQHNIILRSLAAVVAITFFYACSTAGSEKAEPTAISNDSLVKRGSYLVGIMGCDDCHSPKQMGPHGPEIIDSLRLSGYPANRPVAHIDTASIANGWALLGADLTSGAGPWGLTFAANITSDETGIGSWTESNFKKAITEGKWKGLDNSRMLLPTMPWANYKNLKDEDLKAIFAFLKATKPVKNVVPEPRAPGKWN